MDADFDLDEAVKKKFVSYSTKRLIERIEKAPDFGYDDEEVELRRRLRLEGKSFHWNDSLSNPKIIIVEGD